MGASDDVNDHTHLITIDIARVSNSHFYSDIISSLNGGWTDDQVRIGECGIGTEIEGNDANRKCLSLVKGCQSKLFYVT